MPLGIWISGFTTPIKNRKRQKTVDHARQLPSFQAVFAVETWPQSLQSSREGRWRTGHDGETSFWAPAPSPLCCSNAICLGTPHSNWPFISTSASLGLPITGPFGPRTLDSRSPPPNFFPWEERCSAPLSLSSLFSCPSVSKRPSNKTHECRYWSA